MKALTTADFEITINDYLTFSNTSSTTTTTFDENI